MFKKKTRKRLSFLLTLALLIPLCQGIMPERVVEAATVLHNPMIDSNGVTTWDCVWFGNYWQEDTNGDGKVDKNDTKTPIRWRVLSVNGDDAFLLADKNLDCQRYNDIDTDVTWETCTMRNWLNGYYGEEATKYESNNFLGNAFSKSEQSAIRITNVVNHDNPEYGTEGGNDTSDQVYLLSIDEVTNPDYGFTSNEDETKTREAVNTAYVADGGEVNTDFISSAGCTDYWWLRSPGDLSDNASGVSYDGYVSKDGYFVYDIINAVRPALHLNLSALSSWSYAGTVASEGGVKEEAPEAKVTEAPVQTENPENLPTLLPYVSEEPVSTDSPESGMFNKFDTIIGTLEAANLNDFTIKIDGADYDVSDDFDLNEAIDLVVENNGVKVIALLKNNQITNMDPIADVVIPKLSVTPEITNITYKNAKFSQDSFDVKVSAACDFKEPYYTEDVLEALGDTNYSDIGVYISDITLSSSFSNSGEIPYLLKSGLFSSKDTTFTQSYNKFLKLGESKEFTVKAYLKDSYVPESINTVTEFMASVDNMKYVKAEVSISNEDRANEAATIKKQSGTAKSSEINKLNNILNGTQAAFDDTLLREYLTDSEVKAVTAQVNNWIYTSNALNSIINDDSEGILVKKLMKNAHFSKEDLMDTVFKKLGISQAKGMLTFRKPYTGALRFEAKNKKDNKDIVIVFTMNMDFFALGGSSSAYSGFGTISYQIEKAGFNAKSKKSEMNYLDAGSGTGIITYTDYDSFATSLKKVLEGQIHNCYSKLYGEGIDSIADQMLSGTFSQIVNAKYGSASEMVYTSLKYGYTGYDEDDAKKSIKDITIILTKDFVKKTTRLEGHCPVDIIVYDSEGNVCAKITDNTVDTQYDEIIAYVEGDDKYLILPDDDFVVSYAGNDTGTMDCIIKEYENDELVRTIEYTKVPLSKKISYSNYFSEGRRQGNSLYDLYNTENEVMESSTDTEIVENISAKSLTLDVKELELNIGDTYLLKEQFEPFNANNTQIQWSSSNENVAIVDEHGEITAVGDGSAVISAANSFSGLTAVCNVIVLKDENDQPKDEPTNTSKPTTKPSETEKPTTKPEESTKPTTKPAESAKPTTKPTDSTTKPSETTKPNVTSTPGTNVTAKPNNTPENGGGLLMAVKPAKVSIKSVKPGKKKLTAVWKKVSGAKGYRIQIATNRKFTKGLKQYKVSAKTLKKVIKNLKSKKIYFIRIVAWNSNDKGEVINGKYSAVKKIKIK